MNRETQIIELPVSKTKVEIYSYLIARDLFEMNADTNVAKTEYILKNFIVSFGNEKDKAKIFEMVMDLRIEDYTSLDNALLKLINPQTEENKKKQ